MGILSGSGGHKFKKMWERSQIAGPIGNTFGTHTYAYSPENGHELKSNPLIPDGHGG